MFTRKPRLQLEKFAINGAKRLLQHNLPGGDITRARAVIRWLRTPDRSQRRACCGRSGAGTGRSLGRDCSLRAVIEVPSREALINLKTAKSLGLNISDNLLSLADEVIE